MNPTRSAPAPQPTDHRLDTRIRRGCDWLVRQHVQRRPFAGMPATCAPLDVAQAYAIQEAFARYKALHCGALMGWKIALSNPAMQAFVGLGEPVAGRMHERQVVAGPARVSAQSYGRLLVEFEIAVELGADLPAIGRPRVRDEIADAVAAVRPAIELADDRGADYAALASHGLQLVADNAWNEGAVLGERRTNWRELDLPALRGEILFDGVPVAHGHGRDLMGHPLDALAWIAQHAAARGHPMRKGEIAILGSMVTSRFPQSGQSITFSLEGFPPLHLAVD